MRTRNEDWRGGHCSAEKGGRRGRRRNARPENGVPGSVYLCRRLAILISAQVPVGAHHSYGRKSCDASRDPAGSLSLSLTRLYRRSSCYARAIPSSAGATTMRAPRASISAAASPGELTQRPFCTAGAAGRRQRARQVVSRFPPTPPPLSHNWRPLSNLRLGCLSMCVRVYTYACLFDGAL